MKKIALVAVRYGNEINGGAEYHCKMLAERLTEYYQVEVLTTCVINYKTGENEYPEGEETINNVLVRRFKAKPIGNKGNYYSKKAKKAAKVRKILYKAHMLSFLSFFSPVWKYKEKWEIKEYENSVFYSPSLFTFIKENKNNYHAFIPFTIDYPQVFYTAQYAPEKTIVIPTMHYQRAAFRSVLTKVFTKVAYIGFNTLSEQKLAKGIFGPHISPNGIISVGCELTHPADWETVSAKYKLPSEYLLYVGRIDYDKIQQIYDYFLAYKQTHAASKLKFVLVGGCYCEPHEHPDIIYTGFVNEQEKIAIIKHAKIVVNPSKFESLSIILLETMSLGKPMLVNGLCQVMNEHSNKSKHAALPYFNQKDFIEKLHKINLSDKLRTEMGKKGIEYVKVNYDWTLIMKRLINCIEHVSTLNT